MSDILSFGEWVRKRRKALDLTQDELAARAGCSKELIAKIEGGARRPSKQIAQLLAAALLLDAAEHDAFVRTARAEATVDRLPPPAASVPRPALAVSTQGAHPLAQALPSGTVTFLFTDIVGSTHLWDRHPEAMQQALATHDSLLRMVIAEHGGVVVKGTGDGVLAVFPRPVAAVAAAIDAQRALRIQDWGSIGALRVRMALHTGVAEQRSGDYFGLTPSRAARLLAAGHGEQILLSRATYEVVRDHVPAGVVLRDLGLHRLRDVSHPEHIFQVSHPDLTSDFPLLRTIDTRAGNLQARFSALIGRDHELAELRRLLAAPAARLITITGPGGTGKTHLALQAAAEMAPAFADGAWFVDLAPLSEVGEVAGTIAQVLGVSEQVDLPLGTQIAAFLRPRHLLLVLDNFEHLLGAAPLVSELLASAQHVAILVTSRAPLQLMGEQEWPLSPLPLPVEGATFEQVAAAAAVRLFVTRAEGVRSSFALTEANAPAVAAICRRLDGLPLAIELAAVRVKLFPPQALLARLSDALAITALAPRDLPERQRTLEAAIAWSEHLLGERERRLLARLAIFAGGCSLAAAEVVLSDDGADPRPSVEAEARIRADEVLNALMELVSHSLVQLTDGPDGEARFTMLETIRAYAAARLAASGEHAKLARRHATYYAGIVTHDAKLGGYYRENSTWMAWHAAEAANLQVAFAWSVDDEHGADMALSLATSLCAYLHHGNAGTQMRALIDRAMVRFDEAGAHAQAHILLATARLAFFTGHAARSLVAAERAAALWRERGDDLHLGDALLFCAMNTRNLGQLEQSQAYAEMVLAAAQRAGSDCDIAAGLLALGDLHSDRGEQDRAVALFMQARDMARRLGHVNLHCIALVTLARVAYRQQRYAEAIALFEESQVVDGGDMMSQIAWELGKVRLASRQIAQAAAQFRVCLTWSPEEAVVVLCGVEGVGAAALFAGTPLRAARLWGGASKLRGEEELTRDVQEESDFQAWLTEAQARTDATSFHRAWEAGCQMSQEQVVAEALMLADELIELMK